LRAGCLIDSRLFSTFFQAEVLYWNYQTQQHNYIFKTSITTITYIKINVIGIVFSYRTMMRDSCGLQTFFWTFSGLPSKVLEAIG